MNRVVREHYPVEKLPDDLKAGFSDGQQVRLIIETETASGLSSQAEQQTDGGVNDTAQSSDGGRFTRFKHLRRANFKSIEEINEYVSALRDEWAHRER